MADKNNTPGTTLRAIVSSVTGSGSGLFVGLGIAFAGTLALLSYKPTSLQLLTFSYLVPVIFLFIAVGVFLLILLHYAVRLKEGDIKFDATALGLPEGSIRAFIAIALIALVAVFGSFLFFETKSSLQMSTVRTLDLTQAQADQLRPTLPAGLVLITMKVPANDAPGRFEIVSVNSNSSQIDIAKQLLTMIVTVLTTVIGFYFGSRTAEARSDSDLEAKRNEAIAALRSVLGAYEDTIPKVKIDLALLRTNATQGIAEADKQKVESAITPIQHKIDGIIAQMDKARPASTAASADLKTVDDARNSAAKALDDLKAVAPKLAQALNDPQLKSAQASDRIAALQKVSA